tara:strand:+ start:375 stop:563 length:189 start_codon:yes stop_codon:yes gene_type:complete
LLETILEVAEGVLIDAELTEGIRIIGSVIYKIPYGVIGRIVAVATMDAGDGAKSVALSTVGS